MPQVKATVIVELADKASGSVITIAGTAAERQSLLSFTAIVYDPAANPLNTFDVWKAPPLILYS
ncbi:hypothetical protein D3C72_648410 [compost metagenome]